MKERTCTSVPNAMHALQHVHRDRNARARAFLSQAVGDLQLSGADLGVFGIARAKNSPDKAINARTLRAERSPSTRAWSLASIASAATSGDTPA